MLKAALCVVLLAVTAEANEEANRNLQLQGADRVSAAQLLAGAIRGQSLPIGVSEVLLPPQTGASVPSSIQSSAFPVANGERKKYSGGEATLISLRS